MNRRLLNTLIVSLLLLLPSGAEAQVLSFEQGADLMAWRYENARVGLSGMRYKFGSSSLRVSWQPGARITIENPAGLFDASRSRHGGIQVWIYDEGSEPADLQFVFLTSDDREVCRMPFRLGFKGWRALWAKFHQDMGKNRKDIISKMCLVFPQTSGVLYMDMLQFPEVVPWKYMEDAQYSTSRTSFSMIPDIMKYREAEPSDDMIDATEDQIQTVSDRLMKWCLGSGDFPKDKYVKIRTSAEKTFIAKGLAEAEKISAQYNDDGTPVGEPLFTLDGPATVEGKKLKLFRSVNETVLIPLALDYLKNGNESSLEKAKFIYDWFNDQGWADGSSMGTIVLEKLRSSGYFYSYFMLQDKLSPQMRARESAAMDWFTMFGNCYALEEHDGANSDDLRALSVAKLIYALSVEDPALKRQALTAFKRYMDKAMGIAPGALDLIKDDYSGYHHRTAYNSGYYPQAIYAGALIALMLDETPYALSDAAVLNIKNALKRFHFLSAGLDIPAGTVGRFPLGQRILHEVLPAYAYIIILEDGSDKEMLALFNDIYRKATKDPAWMEYVTGVNSDMSYMTTVGEMEAVAKALSYECGPHEMAQGAVFMPYSGLHISKDRDVHFNVKGYSRYIWDYEAGTGQNVYGRWMSNGHLEFFDFRNGNRSFNPSEETYDWNHITGTTSKVLPLKRLTYNGKTTDHRNYSDQSFLAGVHGAEKASMFSVRLHDVYMDSTFRADKSFFFFEDMVLCLGSGVSCSDRKHPVATTLFQDFKGAGKQKGEGLYEDASFAYVVKQGNVLLTKEGKRTIAYVDHGLAPQDSGYEYYMLKNKSAAASVAAAAPVKVVRKDAAAHIVERDGVVCAALFEADIEYDGMLVCSVNIPLAYILEDKGDGLYSLSICEPDMRRASKINMNDLTDEEVAEDAKPFETTLTLDGEFDVLAGDCPVKVEKGQGKTLITIATEKARNYTLQLRK